MADLETRIRMGLISTSLTYLQKHAYKLSDTDASGKTREWIMNLESLMRDWEILQESFPASAELPPEPRSIHIHWRRSAP